MIRNIYLYVISNAINKGSILLFFPFLTQLFSLEDFGRWSLAIIVANLLIPILALNGFAGILREGSVDRKIGLQLLYYYVLITLSIGTLFFLSFYFSSPSWLLYSIAISTFEAILLLVLTFLRTQEKAIIYFLINLIKVITIFTLVIYASITNLSLLNLLKYHFFVSAFFALFTIALQYRHYSPIKISLYPTIIFSIILIPHSIAQWVISSSDRVLIELIFDSKMVGIYSLAYNIALILAIINNGITMALPTYIIKNPTTWKYGNYDRKIINYYTALSMLLLFIIIALYFTDYYYFKLIGYYGDEIIPLIFIIYYSTYLLGLYYFYANHLFYHKKANAISKTTTFAAIINVVLTVLLLYYIGVIGAAIGTLLAYTYYLAAIRHETKKVDNTINIKISTPITIFSMFTFFLYFGISYVTY